MKIGVVIIHGIGRQDKSYANDFIELIKKQYKITGTDELVFESVCWQEGIEPIEQELFNKVKFLSWKPLRSFFVGYVGDALCYQPSTNAVSSFYTSVHKALDESLQNLAKKLDPDSPICIISHSLGTIVASNFIWDCQNGSSQYQISNTTKDLISRLKVLYTLASPLAVWSMRFPNGGMPINLDKDTKWFNFFTRTDIIASPLKLINQHYKYMPNLEDHQVRIGGILYSWNPLSHNAYWDSKLVIKHIAKSLLEL